MWLTVCRTPANAATADTLKTLFIAVCVHLTNLGYTTACEMHSWVRWKFVQKMPSYCWLYDFRREAVTLLAGMQLRTRRIQTRTHSNGVQDTRRPERLQGAVTVSTHSGHAADTTAGAVAAKIKERNTVNIKVCKVSSRCSSFLFCIFFIYFSCSPRHNCS